MTIDELGVILRYIQAACGTRVPFTPEQTAAWFDLIGDLPAKQVQAATKTVLLHHDFASIPAPGQIRREVFRMSQNPPTIPGPEAWRLACAAARRFGIGRRNRIIKGVLTEYDASEHALASLPPAVAYALRCFGYQRLCDTLDEHMGIAERDFLSGYDELAKHAERQGVMPPSVAAIANGIGQIPETTSTQLALNNHQPS